MPSQHSTNVPFSSFHPLALPLHVFQPEGPPWRNSNASIMTFFGTTTPVCLRRRNAPLATVTWTRILAASGLLQQISQTCRRLDRRLHCFLCRLALAGAVSVALMAVVVVMRRLVLVKMRPLFRVRCHAR